MCSSEPEEPEVPDGATVHEGHFGTVYVIAKHWKWEPTWNIEEWNEHRITNMLPYHGHEITSKVHPLACGGLANLSMRTRDVIWVKKCSHACEVVENKAIGWRCKPTLWKPQRPSAKTEFVHCSRSVTENINKLTLVEFAGALKGCQFVFREFQLKNTLNSI